MEKSIRIKFIAAAFISIAVLIIAAFGYIKDSGVDPGSPARGVSVSGAKHKLIFYDSKAFLNGVDYANRNKIVIPPGSKGGIIPHHLFPGFILSDFFSRLSEEAPKRIIIIGPNHAEAGSYKILSSEYAWETPYGTVSPDMETIDKLADNGLIRIDESVLENEHSVAGLMPYIKYYLPNAKVVPIILRSTLNDSEITKLSEEITGIIDKDTFIIASVDFSHYLDSQTAAANDKETLVAMQNFDYEKLYHFSNDHVDSPASVAALLKTMQSLGSTKFNLFFNTNSGFIENAPYSQTTSYFSIMFN